MTIKITYFVHGATLDNETDKCSGQSDIGLSDLGREQNQKLKKLVDGRKFGSVISSDLKRAKETAEFVFPQEKM